MATGMVSLEDSSQLTGASVIKRLREAVKPPGKKALWLNSLTDKQLAEVYHRLKMGQAAHYIVRIVQNDWGHFRKSDTGSLSRAVRRFRKEVLGDLQQDGRPTEEGKKLSDRLENRGKKVADKLDGMGRLGWLIEVQTDRVVALYEKEKASLPFKFTGKEVKTLAEMLETYIRLQIDLGLLDSKPSEYNLTIKHRFDGLLQNSLREDGVAMLDATNRFLELAEQKALTFKLSEDGSYELDKIVGDQDADTPAEVNQN